MKITIKIFFCAITLVAAVVMMTIIVSAQGIALHTMKNDENEITQSKISYGLDVIANDCSIQFAGICGSPLNFSAEKFACAMNLSSVSEIEIVSLPSADCGILYFGNSLAACGQTVSKNSIELLSYEVNNDALSDIPTSFKIKVNNSGYEIECYLYMLDGINASPTLSDVPEISLNVETYRGVKAKGILCGYDPEGDLLTYEIVNYPENGYIRMIDKHSGEYVYTSASDYTGQDSFTYVIKDQYGNYSASATVNIKVSTPYSNVVYNDLIDGDDYNYALNMTEKNIMNGERVGDYYYFRPDSEVSRIDFIVSAMKMLGIENLPDVEKTAFADDDKIGDELKGYISLAYSKQYISGISENGQIYFKPDEHITISEAAVILSNMIGYSEYQTAPTFANFEEIPIWSRQALMSLRALGIIELPDGAEFENVNVNRSLMAKLLSRAAWVSDNV